MALKTTPHLFIVDAKGQIAYQGAIDNAPLGKKPEKYINYADQALSELTAAKDRYNAKNAALWVFCKICCS